MSKIDERCTSAYEELRIAELAEYEILDTPNEAAFDELVEVASIICEAPIAVINFIDRDRQWFKAIKGLPIRETPLDVSICAHAILQSGLFIIPDTTLDERFSSNPLVIGDPHLRFYAGALLENESGYPLGTLCVLDYQPRELTDKQRFALQALANQVMAHMELMLSHRYQKQLILELEATREEMARLAATDMLTGLLNRRAFEQRLHEALALVKRGAPTAALVMVDLDHFKRINDAFGHPVGDDVLKRFTTLCLAVFRETDVIARWGGEEFMLLMPNTSVEKAQQAAKRLLNKLANTSMAAEPTTPIYVTVSIGICPLNANSQLEERLRTVDGLLYQAKRQGRNGVVLENTAPEVTPKNNDS
ncbi:sensor domain-containing diguanylate cyclase [Vreelandella andesensis]|uniref:diguanylate cyclase n=1 Tax=Vreelandella andesensis TaxID=447567 RepID=A0A3S0YVC2_9GAMM|nr:sensor domain-containing diguanylate cyclase [Halomonas andesensis]RUR30413.1 sensor domain-containing diguanylate cyclase [Halomonas andesensis]